MLVQDGLTAAPMPSVMVRMTRLGRPVLEFPATREAATNKLFRAAQFVLPESGRWEIQVQVEGVHGTAVVGGEMEAAGPLPHWARRCGRGIGWPVVAIARIGYSSSGNRNKTAYLNRVRRSRYNRFDSVSFFTIPSADIFSKYRSV